MLLVKGSGEEKSMTTADFFGPSSPILLVNAAENVAVAVTSAVAAASAVAATSAVVVAHVVVAVAAAAFVVAAAAFVAASAVVASAACIASVDDFHSFGIAAVAFAPHAHTEQLLGIVISVQVNIAEKQIAESHTQDAGDLQLNTAAPA